MKGWNILTIIVAALGLMAAGAALAWIGSGFEPQPDLAAWCARATAAAPAYRLGFVAAGVLAALAGLGLAWGNLASRRWERLIILRNPLGEVHISLAALEDLGRVVKGDVPGLRDVKLRISASRRGLKVVARVSLLAGDDLGAVTEAVQVAIRRRLQQVLGAEQDVRPRVVVGRVVPRSEDEDGAPRRRLRPPRP
jgi:hypothetical protein